MDRNVPASTHTPEENALRNETQAKLRAAIAALPGNQRMALQLKRHEGLSYAEIAEVMNCTVSAVESLLFRANASLKKSLDIIQ